MVKGLIQQLKDTLVLDQPDELIIKHAKARLKEWKRWYIRMESDENSDLWSYPFFCAVHKEFIEIFKLLKSKKYIDKDFIPKKKK